MDYKKYHPDWKDIIRPAILKRDNYKCQACGVKHKAIGYWDNDRGFVVCEKETIQEKTKYYKRVAQIILQVSHQDQNPNNNNYENLLSLCHKCHLAYDRQFNAVKRIANMRKSSFSQG